MFAKYTLINTTKLCLARCIFLSLTLCLSFNPMAMRVHIQYKYVFCFSQAETT